MSYCIYNLAFSYPWLFFLRSSYILTATENSETQFTYLHNIAKYVCKQLTLFYIFKRLVNSNFSYYKNIEYYYAYMYISDYFLKFRAFS